MFLWPFHHFFSPVQVGLNLFGGFAIKMFGVGLDMFIVRCPGVEVAQKEMVFSAPGLAKCDQVVGVQFQVWVKVERLDMMDLPLSPFITAGYARWFAQEMFLCYTGPFGASFVSMILRYTRPMVYFAKYVYSSILSFPRTTLWIARQA